MTEFEEYKTRLQQWSGYAELKETVHNIIVQKGLSSVMNDTKWLKLQKAIDSLPFPPPFSERLLTYTDDYPISPMVEGLRTCYGNCHGNWSSFWEEGLAPFFVIEWLKVKPRYAKYRGRLVADEIFDETEEFVALLKKLSIPYEEENGLFMIYGYK
jgi:hypothetical protein